MSFSVTGCTVVHSRREINFNFNYDPVQVLECNWNGQGQVEVEGMPSGVVVIINQRAFSPFINIFATFPGGDLLIG